MFDAIGPPWIQKASGNRPLAPFGLTRKVWIGVPSVERTLKFSISVHFAAGVNPESRASGLGIAPRSGLTTQHSGASTIDERIAATRPSASTTGCECAPPASRAVMRTTAPEETAMEKSGV